MKKAQGMSLNVIVVAVLVLVILIVLVLVFSGKLKIFGSKTTETTDALKNCMIPGTNSECMSSKADCDKKYGSWEPAPEEGFKDCMQIGSFSYGGCCRT